MAAKVYRLDEDEEASLYQPDKNNYDLSKDPRCLFGWGCRYHLLGHGCFRKLGHKGKCQDLVYPPRLSCETRQRPKNWDTEGRAEANK